MRIRWRPHWLGLLERAERERAEGLGDSAAGRIFLTSRAAQRLICSRYTGQKPAAVPIDRSCPRCAAGHGRPRMPGSAFDYSVSHTAEWLLAAVVGEGLVGVDIDQVESRNDVTALATKVFSPAELQAFTRLPERGRTESFLTSWTRKEAAVKLTGHGLAAAPARIDVRFEEVRADGIADWPGEPVLLRDVPAPAAHRAALATTVPVRSLRWRVGDGNNARQHLSDR